MSIHNICFGLEIGKIFLITLSYFRPGNAFHMYRPIDSNTRMYRTLKNPNKQQPHNNNEKTTYICLMNTSRCFSLIPPRDEMKPTRVEIFVNTLKVWVQKAVISI